MYKSAVAVTLGAGLIASPLLVAPAHAAPIPRKAMQEAIQSQLRDQFNQRAKIRCPKKKWKKGKVFFCRAKAANGSKYRIRVKLGSQKSFAFKWLQVP
jgi:hypothetical protein